MTYRPDEDIVLEWTKTDSTHGRDRSTDAPDPAEVRRLRGIERRAREAYEAPDATMDERIVLRHILGEGDRG